MNFNDNVFIISADPEGPGICAMFLTLVSFLLVLVTLPFSLCVTVKVSLLTILGPDHLLLLSVYDKYCRKINDSA